jgi:hypothetical protein
MATIGAFCKRKFRLRRRAASAIFRIELLRAIFVARACSIRGCRSWRPASTMSHAGDAAIVQLTVPQRIVKKHGGTIWASSTPGCGATFYFTLGEGTS